MGQDKAFRGTTMALASALVLSIAVSAILCTVLFPSDATEVLASANAGNGLDHLQTEDIALQLAEGKTTPAERRDVAAGRINVMRKRLSAERGSEQRALRLAEGKLSPSEKRSIAIGDVMSIVKGKKGSRTDGFDNQALRLAEGKLSSDEARAIADGEAVTDTIQMHKAKGVREPEALRLAEGKLSRDEKRAIADGDTVRQMQQRQRTGRDANALVLAAAAAQGGDGQSGVIGVEPRRVKRQGSESEALRLAEGNLTPAEQKRIAAGVTAGDVSMAAAKKAGKKRRVELSDLTVEEKSRRIQHLLEVAASIGARKYKARPQQLAQADSMMMGDNKPTAASLFKQREIQKLVSRIDSESSGSIQEAGTKPSEWRSVEKDVLQPRTPTKSSASLAVRGMDSIARGAQQSMSDVRVPLDAIRRGWGGL